MIPGARISAAIDCLDQIFSGTPAEKALTSWARRSRFAGSKDRAAVRDHVFDALRCRDSYAALGGGLSGRSVMIGLARAQKLAIEDLFSGIGHAPKPLSVQENEASQIDWFWDLPEWCVERLQSSHPSNARDIANALKSRAPVDLRVNIRKATSPQVQQALESEGILATPFELVENCLRISENARKLKLSSVYSDGLVELQDAGSQALVNAMPLSDQQKVLDYCAGGGGKSLAIAAQVEAACFAHDVNTARMNDIPLRAARAGVQIECLATSELSQHSPYDLVLCDAPCSGSGAWRRSPDAKWKFTKERFEDLLKVQGEILETAQNFVREGGFLCYATCSLFAEENEHQVNKFLNNNSKFELLEQKSWTPLDQCDGFYIATLQLKG